MIVWRIVKAKYPANTSRGAAARWNEAETKVIYTASSLALSALEVLASQSTLVDDYVCVRVDIPDDIPISVFSEKDLPPDWCAYPHPKSAQAFGTNWAKSLTTAVMSVPSSVIRLEQNYILNTAHPDFARLAWGDRVPFVFDERLRVRYQEETEA